MSVPRIVIVDDNPPDVLVFRECLRRRGIAHALEHYLNGEDAAKAVVEMTTAPDLFVLDLNVPRIQGLELLLLIRANRLTARTPVAILTSSQAANDRTRAEQRGVDLYIVKPCGLSEYVDQVGGGIAALLDRRISSGGAKSAA